VAGEDQCPAPGPDGLPLLTQVTLYGQSQSVLSTVTNLYIDEMSFAWQDYR
jgi:hypothetical protein